MKNTELVRHLYERFNAGEDVPAELIADDFELYDPELPGGGVFRGVDGLADYLRRYLDAWEDYRVEVEEMREVGDRVVALLHHVGRGKGSGVQSELRDAHVWTVKDGLVLRWRTYLDRAEALRDVGLAPETADRRAGENAAAVRRAHEHFSLTGKPLAEVCAPEVEWTTAREDPDSDTYRGLAEVERLFDNWTGMFPGLQVESDEYLETDDKVFAWVRLRGAGGGSGAGVMMEQAQVWTFRDGKAIRIEEYFDREDGLRAANLRE